MRPARRYDSSEIDHLNNNTGLSYTDVGNQTQLGGQFLPGYERIDRRAVSPGVRSDVRRFES